MKVNLSQIRRMEGSSIRVELSSDFPDFEFGSESIMFTKPVQVNLSLTNTGKELLVHGVIITELRVCCGRCLKEFLYPLEIPYDDEWVAANKATAEQKENALLYSKDEVDIQERIFEQIMLALPMKWLCSQECRGLCPHCGQNLNMSQCSCDNRQIDPRMADLAKWHQEN
jgi:uncharacterized protein